MGGRREDRCRLAAAAAFLLQAQAAAAALPQQWRLPPRPAAPAELCSGTCIANPCRTRPCCAGCVRPWRIALKLLEPVMCTRPNLALPSPHTNANKISRGLNCFSRDFPSLFDLLPPYSGDALDGLERVQEVLCFLDSQFIFQHPQMVF